MGFVRLLLLCLIISTISALFIFDQVLPRLTISLFDNKKNRMTWNLTRSAQLSRVAADCQLVGLGQSAALPLWAANQRLNEPLTS